MLKSRASRKLIMLSVIYGAVCADLIHNESYASMPTSFRTLHDTFEGQRELMHLVSCCHTHRVPEYFDPSAAHCNALVF